MVFTRTVINTFWLHAKFCGQNYNRPRSIIIMLQVQCLQNYMYLHNYTRTCHNSWNPSVTFITSSSILPLESIVVYAYHATKPPTLETHACFDQDHYLTTPISMPYRY